MKHHTGDSWESPFPDFEDDGWGGTSPDRRRSQQRQAERKTLQLCRQVQRVLNLALANRFPNEELFVDSVMPAPDASRLLITVVTASGAELQEQLFSAAPQLRAEVAAAIQRKKAPELSFVVMASEDSYA